MNEVNIENLITSKHGKVLNIAKVANIFTTITIFVFGLLFVLSAYDLYLAFVQKTGVFQPNSSQLELSTAVDILRAVMAPLLYLVQGAIISLVLKGISVGLNMIVETDLNYREKSMED